MKRYKRLQVVRTKKKYTLKKLGRRLGITKQYVWDIEDGRKTLSYKMAFKMSKILESTPDEIFLKDYKRKQ